MNPIDYTTAISETIAVYDNCAAEFAARNWQAPVSEMRESFLTGLQERRPGAGRRILDAGCGPGRDTAYFTQIGHRVIAGDLALGMLAEARARVPEARLLQMDLRQPPFAPRSFDAVWMCASLLHVPKQEWSATLARYRPLLDGGLLFLSVKSGAGEQRMPGYKYRDYLRFFSYVSEQELTSILADAGFRVLALHRAPEQPEHDWLQAHACAS